MWFINFDETQHNLSTEAPKQGPLGRRFQNTSFPHSSNRTVKSNQHATKVYTTSPLKPLPPLYFFDTKAKKKKYKIDPAWCQGLPKVHRKYGNENVQTWESFVAMRPEGGMDYSLFPTFIKNVLIPCFPYLQKEGVCDPVTGC